MAQVRSCRRSECSRAPARPRQQVGDIQAWADGVYTHQTFQVTEEPGAEPEPIRSVARRLLGLNETDADTLFDANNTRDYVLGSLADYIDMGEAQERTAAGSQLLGGC